MRAGYVYVVQSTPRRWVKVGWAKDIARRMVEVAGTIGSDLVLLGCKAGSQADETSVQRSFAHLRIAYDWFVPGDDLLAYANSLPSPVVISFVGSASKDRRSFAGRLAKATHARRGPHISVATLVA